MMVLTHNKMDELHKEVDLLKNNFYKCMLLTPKEVGIIRKEFRNASRREFNNEKVNNDEEIIRESEVTSVHDCRIEMINESGNDIRGNETKNGIDVIRRVSRNVMTRELDILRRREFNNEKGNNDEEIISENEVTSVHDCRIEMIDESGNDIRGNETKNGIDVIR